MFPIIESASDGVKSRSYREAVCCNILTVSLCVCEKDVKQSRKAKMAIDIFIQAFEVIKVTEKWPNFSFQNNGMRNLFFLLCLAMLISSCDHLRAHVKSANDSDEKLPT